MNTTLSPYIMFNGNCKEAMEFYKSIFGGEVKSMTYGESPNAAPESKDLVMHASLENGAVPFMASDATPDHPAKVGDNIHMSIAGDNLESATNYFNKLSEGGNVISPLKKEFWGDTFGMLVDKFGIHWMFNISGATN